MTDTDDRLAQIRDRTENATQGPWRALTSGVRNGDHWSVHYQHSDARWWPIAHIASQDGANEGQRQPDAEFIAHARQDVPWLLDQLDQARRGGKTLGKIVDRQCRDVLNATDMHHVINRDGDGDWGLVWERLAEMRQDLILCRNTIESQRDLIGILTRERDEWEANEQTAARERDEAQAEVERLVLERDQWKSLWKGTVEDASQVRAELSEALAALDGGGQQ